MATVVMSISQWSKEMKKLGKNFKPTVLRGMRSGALRTIPLLQQRTRDVGAVDTGNYLRRWRTRAISNGVEVTNSAPYAAVIEYGRRPGARFPPISAIRRWAKLKLGLSEAQAKAAAFPIARAIAKRGQKPRSVLTSVEPQITKAIEAEVAHELAEAMKP